MQRHASKLRSAVEVEWRIRRYVIPAIGHRPLAAITRRELSDWLHGEHARIIAGEGRRTGRPGSSGVGANRLLALVRAMFAKAVLRGGGSTVAQLTDWNARRSSGAATSLSPTTCCRKRAHTGQLPDPRMTLALRLQLITAARLGEVVGAKLAELDLAAATWDIPAERSKNKRAHHVPLSPFAVSLFSEALALADLRRRTRQARRRPEPVSEFLFPGWRVRTAPRHLHPDAVSKALAALVTKTGLPPFTSHDLRRTAATGMAASAADGRAVLRAR